MAVNTELTSLWGDVAEAIRQKDETETLMTPEEMADRIRGIPVVGEDGKLAIYVSCPANTTVTARHEDGEYVVTDTADVTGKLVLWVDKPGTYTLTGVTSSGTSTTSATVTVASITFEYMGGGGTN